MHSAKVVEAKEGPTTHRLGRQRHVGRIPGYVGGGSPHAINKRVLPEVYRKTGDVSSKYLAILDLLVAPVSAVSS